MIKWIEYWGRSKRERRLVYLQSRESRRKFWLFLDGMDANLQRNIVSLRCLHGIYYTLVMWQFSLHLLESSVKNRRVLHRHDVQHLVAYAHE